MVHLKVGPVHVSGAKLYKPGTPNRAMSLIQTPQGEIAKGAVHDPQRAKFEYILSIIWHQTLAQYESLTNTPIRSLLPTLLGIGKPIDTQLNQSNKTLSEVMIATKKVDGIPVTRLEGILEGSIATNYNDTYRGPQYQSIPLDLAYLIGGFTKIRYNEGMMHGDFDPRNIKFNQNGPVLYVCDFSDTRRATLEMIEWENEKILDGLYSLENPRRVKSAYSSGLKKMPKTNIFWKVFEEFTRRNQIEVDFDYMVAYLPSDKKNDSSS